MKSIIILIFSAVGLLLNINISIADDSCVFDKNYFSNKTYKTKKLVKSYVWNESNQTANILTSSGSLITAQHWDCRHIGIKAIMLLNSVEAGNESIVRNKLSEIIEIFVRKQDRSSVQQSVTNMKCLDETRCRHNFTIEGYSEFYIETERQQDSMTILLKYYSS
ncbi:MAG: hypothetical protein OEY52_08485 [Gammaproteobacteria bacterium]|nr:hypothetical protein [Gammaproteobacteria bacterium]